MQVERELTQADLEHQKHFLDKVYSRFQQPEPYESEKLEAYLEEPDVKEVHVFKATPRNMKMAELRVEYPNKTRKQLRKML